MGRSRTIGHYHGEKCLKLHLEKYHLPFWNPQGLCLWQWKAIWQWSIQGFLPSVRDKEPLLLPRPPLGNRQVKVTNRSLLKMIKIGGKRYMAGRRTWSPMGISDDDMQTYRGDTLPPRIRKWSHHTNRSWVDQLLDSPLWQRREREWDAPIVGPSGWSQSNGRTVNSSISRLDGETLQHQSQTSSFSDRGPGPKESNNDHQRSCTGLVRP